MIPPNAVFYEILNSLLVGVEGFEPPMPKPQIYSLLSNQLLNTPKLLDFLQELNLCFLLTASVLTIKLKKQLLLNFVCKLSFSQKA